MNRITTAIANMQPRVDALKPEQATEMDKVNTFAFDEYSALMTRNSLAVASGKLSAEEGQTIYMIAGEGDPSKLNKQPLATRIVLTMVLAELLGIR